jgi:GNAT superfamily N-acetyltransferase
MQIAVAQSADDVAEVRRLFEEYWASFGFTPCFQNFSGELTSLPGEYVRPRGVLALARIEGRCAGCAALRPFDATRCEAKRLYVRPEFRGLGVGLALLEWVVARAREAGYREMVGDTMPVMEQALKMYDRFGFERSAPYSDAPTPGAIYLRFRL